MALDKVRFTIGKKVITAIAINTVISGFNSHMNEASTSIAIESINLVCMKLERKECFKDQSYVITAISVNYENKIV